jgi:hypothetical protein
MCGFDETEEVWIVCGRKEFRRKDVEGCDGRGIKGGGV